MHSMVDSIRAEASINTQKMADLPVPRPNPVHILIVDDEPATLQLLGMVLKAEGMIVHEAQDGAEALREFRRIRPELVLLDVMLPKMDGVEVLKAIRAEDTLVGIVMISALSSEQLAVKSLLSGADDFISKPVALKELRKHIRQALERVQLRRENLQLQEQLVEANKKLRHYMAAPLIESVLASPSPPSLGGERQTVTILFLDFCDFTSLTNSYAPDEVVRILNEYFSLLTTSILENDGYLDKIMGDGFMALFNVPTRRANHATLAVRSAMEMRRRVHEWNWSNAEGQAVMNIRAGIHTGEAVVGNIGTANLMNFTAIGSEVNLAKRLEEEALPGQILLSADTLALLDREQLDLSPDQVVSAGWRRLRGFEQARELFQIVNKDVVTA